MSLICQVVRERVLFHPDGGRLVVGALAGASAEAFTPVFRGGSSPVATWHARSYQAARSAVVGSGLATDAEYDELALCMGDRHTTFEGLSLFGIVGRRAA